MKLFFSFSSLLECLVHNKLSEEDLAGGLFAVQTAKSVVFFTDPENPSVQTLLSPFDEKEKQHRLQIWREVIQPAIHKADEQGRAIWKLEGTLYISYECFAAFLRVYGFDIPLECSSKIDSIYPFSSHRLKAWLEAIAPGLEVIAA